MRRRPFLFSLGATVVAPSVGGAGLRSAVAQTGDGAYVAPVTDLGEPVIKRQTLASAIAPTPEGVPMAYFLASGNPNLPGEFAALNLRTGETVLNVRITADPSSQRAMDVSPHDHAVYFATSEEGHLYRHQPGSTTVEHLGVLPGADRAWGLTVGEDGTVWIGAYPSGKLYSLDPVSLEVTDHGQAMAGEQYIDGLAADGDTIWIGTQSTARLISFDRTTGVFTDVEMPAEHSSTAISSLAVRGGKLFVGSTHLWVRDLASGTWDGVVEGGAPNVSPIDPRDPDAVYLRLDGEIKRYSLSTGEVTGTGNRPNAAPEAWGWADRDGTGEHPVLAMTYWNGGRTYGLKIHDGDDSFYLVPDLEGSGAPLTALGSDVAGRVYAGAFLSPPGMGRFDPAGDGTIELLTGTSQVEGFGRFGDDLVFGRYPQGSLHHYDVSEPWQYGTNPAPRELGDGQSRPQTFVELASLPGTVAVASVPVPGAHGGAVSLWQPDANTHTVHRNIIDQQTPVGLVEHDGLLIGSTSIEGGYGIDPVTEAATIFAWNPVAEALAWSETIEGARAISGLAVAPDDQRLWAVVDGRRVIEFDLTGRMILRTVVVDEAAVVPRYGDDNRLLFDHGRLFGSLANRLVIIDRVTGAVTSLYGLDSGRGDGVDTVSELTQDGHGDLYVIGSSTRLVRYALPPAADVAVPAVRTEPAGRRVRLHFSAGTGRIDASVAGGAWTEQRSTRPLLVEPGATVRYRAIDAAWNSSPVGEFRA